MIDAVGTLIEAHPAVAQVYAEAAARQGVRLDPEQVRGRFGRAFDQAEAGDLRDRLSTDENREIHRWRRIVAEVLPDLPDPDRAFRELWDHFGRPDAWTLFDDVPDVLADLDRRGLPVRIGSNFDARLRAIVAGLPGLERYQETLLISSMVGWRKPDPRFFEAACRSLGLDRARVLVVGDDRENDYQGPRRLGMPSVLLDRRGRAVGPVDRIASLADLGGWIARGSLSGNTGADSICRAPRGDL